MFIPKKRTTPTSISKLQHPPLVDHSQHQHARNIGEKFLVVVLQHLLERCHAVSECESLAFTIAEPLEELRRRRLYLDDPLGDRFSFLLCALNKNLGRNGARHFSKLMGASWRVWVWKSKLASCLLDLNLRLHQRNLRRACFFAKRNTFAMYLLTGFGHIEGICLHFSSITGANFLSIFFGFETRNGKYSSHEPTNLQPTSISSRRKGGRKGRGKGKASPAQAFVPWL